MHDVEARPQGQVPDELRHIDHLTHRCSSSVIGSDQTELMEISRELPGIFISAYKSISSTKEHEKSVAYRGARIAKKARRGNAVTPCFLRVLSCPYVDNRGFQDHTYRGYTPHRGIYVLLAFHISPRSAPPPPPSLRPRKDAAPGGFPGTPRPRAGCRTGWTGVSRRSCRRFRPGPGPGNGSGS